MLPSFSMENVADSRHSDSVTTSYGGHRFAGFYSVDDDRDVVFGEFGVGMGAAERGVLSVPVYAILSIVGLSTQDQMIGVDTNLVVASVPDDEAYRDLALV